MTTQSPTYTWASLLALVPAPTPAESARYALDAPSGDLIERGAKIRSEKILTDMVRLGGIAAEFWAKVTDTQKRNLLGFSAPIAHCNAPHVLHGPQTRGLRSRERAVTTARS